MKLFQNEPLKAKAHQLVHEVYDLTEKFPPAEKFVLTSQLRRSALSTPSNIIEGYARHRNKVFLNHLEIAYGSFMETKYYLYFACQRGYITAQEYMKVWQCAEEVGKMLWKAIESMEAKVNSET